MSAWDGSRQGRNQYDIAGILRVASAVRLPELAFFRTERGGSPDLIIEVGLAGGLRPRWRRSLERHRSSLVYREHLGSLAGNFAIEIGTPVLVTAGPLLALSPHVLYTNIIEALLRFLFVTKERMLLHAACIGLGGAGVLLSARTDTGKTGTVLRLLGNGDGTFFSDDMTIIDGEGMASCYPKPLTISAHTLRAVDQRRLQVRERAALYVQSRVHSRGGRSIGHRLGRHNLPIMSINAALQAAVPPPKYQIGELSPCAIGQRIAISHLYLLERGRPRRYERLAHTDAVDQLIANTEDAYGFPPYAQLAPQLVLGGRTTEQLLQRERLILEAALRSVPATRVRVDDFSWATVIESELARVAAGVTA